MSTVPLTPHFICKYFIVLYWRVWIVYTPEHITMLMSIELILNSVNINFVAFINIIPGKLDGVFFSIFIVAIAAAEAAVAIAIIIKFI